MTYVGALRIRGSSPLTRGKRRARHVGGRRTRLIPAHAGKTVARGATARAIAAHPRSRGENRARRARSARENGSSPLTRGKLGLGGVPAQLSRLIPAHAGKTIGATVTAGGSEAHPRSRGENTCSARPLDPCGGSSPLTRGKHHLSAREISRDGLIPAHAGKTMEDQAHRAESAAHPRSRGENCRDSWSRSSLRGSSPLTRGKQRGLRWCPSLPRLIPAHAGKTTILLTWVQGPAAHPRSRGENSRARDKHDRQCGSSPLTRGKPATRAHPALPPAHPRSRGENAPLWVALAAAVGSSPLTRGKLL